jgi:hypothetical protein
VSVEATGNHALDVVLMWGGVITALAGLAALLWRSVRASVRLARRVEDFMDDWAGEPGRPGVQPRPGVMERLAGFEERLTRVEHELYPNSGQSLRDAVDRANERLLRLCPDPDSDDPESP